MKLSRLFVISALALVFSLLPSAAHAQSDRLQIVATYSILADVVGNVAGEVADVTAVMPTGTDPHTFSPSPGDITLVADADVVFLVGINFEESLIEAIEEAAADTNVVVTSSCVPVLAAGSHTHEDDEEDHTDELTRPDGVDGTVAQRCARHELELADMHEHEDGEEDAHSHAEILGTLYTLDCGGHERAGHDHGACDPHVWTDPHNVILWTFMIRDTLSALDPANAEIYADNAETYIAELTALDQDFIVPMVESIPEAQRVLLTNHETLGYFANAYGFEVIATVIPGAGTLAEPSAADLARLIDLIRAEGVSAVFAENTVGTRIAEQIAQESGAQFYTLYSDSLSDADGPAATYLDYMRYNVTTIVQALGGGLQQ